MTTSNTDISNRRKSFTWDDGLVFGTEFRGSPRAQATLLDEYQEIYTTMTATSSRLALPPSWTCHRKMTDNRTGDRIFIEYSFRVPHDLTIKLLPRTMYYLFSAYMALDWEFNHKNYRLFLDSPTITELPYLPFLITPTEFIWFVYWPTQDNVIKARADLTKALHILSDIGDIKQALTRAYTLIRLFEMRDFPNQDSKTRESMRQLIGQFHPRFDFHRNPLNSCTAFTIKATADRNEATRFQP